MSNGKNIMKFRVALEYDGEAQGFSAVCPELPGCASAGGSEEEAMRNIAEAIRLYLSPAEIELPENARVAEVTVWVSPHSTTHCKSAQRVGKSLAPGGGPFPG
jgi:predicted RNase H-like HicB family nuclease